MTNDCPSKTNRVLFCGPRAKLIERIYIAISHTPMFCYMFYNVLVTRIIPFTWRYLQPGYKNTTATDKVIFELLTASSLITITKINETGDKISFQIPEDFDCKLMCGFNPAGLEIVMDIAEQRLEKAEIKGESLSNEYVLTSLVIAYTLWIHPQIHVSSEKCAREIQNKPSKLHQIKESSRFVVALHDALFYFPFSPGPLDEWNSFLSVGASTSFYAYMLKPSSKVRHDLDPRKNQFPFFKFLIQARLATVQLLKKHEIDINPEIVFNNMVLHSVDHYAPSLILKNVDYLFGSHGWRSYVTGQIFSHIWIPTMGSIASDERIALSKKPFYQQLYQRCAAVDKDLADNIFYSTSF